MYNFWQNVFDWIDSWMVLNWCFRNWFPAIDTCQATFHHRVLIGGSRHWRSSIGGVSIIGHVSVTDCAKVQSSRHLRILLSQCGINDCQCPNHHSITLWLTCWVSFAVCDMRMSIKCVLINFTVLWFQETSWCPILYILPISDLCFWYKY